LSDIDKYLTTEEIADSLRVHKVTIVRWIRDGRLAAKKVGRRWLIKETDYNSFVEKSEDLCVK
jgi:excisionase family DNA binding protein